MDVYNNTKLLGNQGIFMFLLVGPKIGNKILLLLLLYKRKKG